MVIDSRVIMIQCLSYMAELAFVLFLNYVNRLDQICLLRKKFTLLSKSEFEFVKLLTEMVHVLLFAELRFEVHQEISVWLLIEYETSDSTDEMTFLNFRVLRYIAKGMREVDESRQWSQFVYCLMQICYHVRCGCGCLW